MRERANAERMQKACFCVSRDTRRHARESGCRAGAQGMPSNVARLQTACEIGRMQSGCLQLSQDTGWHAFSYRETTGGTGRYVRERMKKGCIGYAFSCRETTGGMREMTDAERMHRVCLQLSRDTGRHARESGCRADT
jgi:hypothetical protein